ncbi:hypothetical protein J6590_096968 [Homalodisca vitripennis]|nr:hypothetical protein J6590_096968 [Homalodisca vitripennis]
MFAVKCGTIQYRQCGTAWLQCDICRYRPPSSLITLPMLTSQQALQALFHLRAPDQDGVGESIRKRSSFSDVGKEKKGAIAWRMTSSSHVWTNVSAYRGSVKTKKLLKKYYGLCVLQRRPDTVDLRHLIVPMWISIPRLVICYISGEGFSVKKSVIANSFFN